jgi:hypothetical protein
MTEPRIDYCQTKYMKVSASEVDSTGGVVIPNGQAIAVTGFRANGADPAAYVELVWDYGGGAEKIIASTRGDIDLVFDTLHPDVNFTGDGSKTLCIVIVNDNESQSPVIGGAWTALKM